MKKDEGMTVLAGLLKAANSLARSDYYPARELLAARFPAWPVSLLLRTTWTFRTPPDSPCRCQA